MDEGAHKEVQRLLSTFDDERISKLTEAANDDVELDVGDDVRKKAA